jgi:hypothetical protein
MVGTITLLARQKGIDNLVRTAEQLCANVAESGFLWPGIVRVWNHYSVSHND